MAKLGNLKSGAFSAAGNAPVKISIAGAALGVGFDMVSAKRDERALIAELAEEYRPEIAERYNLAPGQLTAEHFGQAAQEADVLSQAVEVGRIARKEKTLSSAIAGVVGAAAGVVAGIFAWNGSPILQQPDSVEHDPSKKAFDPEAGKRNSSNIAGGITATLGAMFAGKISRRVIHKKSDIAVAIEDTAHGAIMAIKEKQQHAEPVTPADVFAVMVALNPEVGKAIEQAYDSPYKALENQAKMELIATEFPDVMEYTAVMAERINQGARPQGLLFGEVQEVAAVKNRPDVAADAVETQISQDAEPVAAREEDAVSVTEAGDPPRPQAPVETAPLAPAEEPAVEVVPARAMQEAPSLPEDDLPVRVEQTEDMIPPVSQPPVEADVPPANGEEEGRHVVPEAALNDILESLTQQGHIPAERPQAAHAQKILDERQASEARGAEAAR